MFKMFEGLSVPEPVEGKCLPFDRLKDRVLLSDFSASPLLPFTPSASLRDRCFFSSS
ncbi:MAG: hypothetical protein M0R39_11745 [Prolixibacteraceae bacterium]|nr:hypothetical protein [Prolixibacteraceae bacterium]